MKFTLEINCDGAAFDGENLSRELHSILAYSAERVSDRTADEMLWIGEFAICDINGNRVGKFVFTEGSDK